MNLVSVPFFTLPQVLVRSGVLSEMKPGEVSLAVALYHEMERRSKPAFSITNAELHTLTGLSPSSFRAARTKLAERYYIHVTEPHVMTGFERFLNYHSSKLADAVPKQTGRVQ